MEGLGHAGKVKKKFIFTIKKDSKFETFAGSADSLTGIIAGDGFNHTCNVPSPSDLFMAAKNFAEADGFMILVYLLIILGKNKTNQSITESLGPIRVAWHLEKIGGLFRIILFIKVN